MGRNSESVKKWRKNTKQRMVDSMGGKCQCCGYNKCVESLDFHHINPEEKEKSLASMRGSPKSWKTIIKELRKCILVCRNCHGEIHYGNRRLPKMYQKFDESFAEYKQDAIHELSPCPQCGKMKPVYNKFCSLPCSSRSKFRVNWDEIDLKQLMSQYSFVKIAEMLNISDNAVRKRAKKLGLI